MQFGIDNLAIGVPKPFECHNVLLTDHGIYIMKKFLDLQYDVVSVQIDQKRRSTGRIDRHAPPIGLAKIITSFVN